MRTETQTVGVRQGVDESTDPILFALHELAVLTTHRIDAMTRHLRSQHRRDFVREESGAVYDAACFNFPGGTDDANSTRQNLQFFSPRICDDVGPAIRGDTSIGLHKLLARDDPRGRNLDRLHAFDVRLASANGSTVNQPEPLQT